MTPLTGWGRYPRVESSLVSPASMEAARIATTAHNGSVARGNGRAYGDAAIGVRSTIGMTALDRVRRFDAETGRITVEAGVLLADLIATYLPRGFFPTVVPGTKFVTVGGAIAADIHGKNHHGEGGFGDHLESFMLATPDGAIVHASRTDSPEVFQATIGGMGLTGTILEATLKLRRVETGWIRQRTVVAEDLAAAIAALDAGDSATYSVAWIDCAARGRDLGRSLIFLGEHARADQLDTMQRFPKLGAPRLSMPFELPMTPLNRWSVGAFNALYFRMGARRAERPFLTPIGPYFFPLDGIGDWNRIYGRQGFVQHQCVLPLDTAPGVLAEMLGRIAARGDASFLAVLKKLGPASGILSFPMPGLTLALDFAVSPGLFEFLDELDRLVVGGRGRLYLAKDARQSRATFEAGYPSLDRFRAVRSSIDPTGRIRSHLAERLGL